MGMDICEKCGDPCRGGTPLCKGCIDDELIEFGAPEFLGEDPFDEDDEDY